MGVLKFVKKTLIGSSQDVIKSFVLSDDHEGFHRYRMVVYGNEVAMKNNKKLSSKELAGRKVTFKKASNCAQVWIDNLWVGTLYDNEFKGLNKITAVYAENDEELIITNNGEVRRPRIRLWVK